MRILVLSDSHSGLSFMRQCVELLHPDRILHLGDYVADAETLSEENPHIPVYMVAGNCDRWRMVNCPETLIEDFCGVRIFMTHGHLQNVKVYTDKLIQQGRNAGADIILYGHTHEPDCRRLEGGTWIMNPGSCSTYSGSVGLIRLGEDSIVCEVLSASDLEGYT